MLQQIKKLINPTTIGHSLNSISESSEELMSPAAFKLKKKQLSLDKSSQHQNHGVPCSPGTPCTPCGLPNSPLISTQQHHSSLPSPISTNNMHPSGVLVEKQKTPRMRMQSIGQPNVVVSADQEKSSTCPLDSIEGVLEHFKAQAEHQHNTQLDLTKDSIDSIEFEHKVYNDYGLLRPVRHREELHFVLNLPHLHRKRMN
ncbi:hypothetical protein C9374_008757 [Naegleria lovaniensis]|uniref:Uncharacterized protein n=1 Tax=Naegleria lovaniensis TaxID=51637 RepID=A0AA88GJC4_NAELO|nr:uncharacterized protein C9374_008757 [Naegleria lovaniensis]KAG2378135.1 hypothetical protein C9374_008757 [Naegleria lovaniensis]